ncbi:MAG: EamA family transporter RarD [Burkholderiales bacterium]|nr:EamA family transporter RarD [Burkholderiales bacterium]
MQRGIVYAALAYLLWGLFPLYFIGLREVASIEVLAHRVVWSLVFLGVLLAVRRQFGWLGPALRDSVLLRRFALSATLLAVNWGVYIWAINEGRVVEASLGYFITPLANVLTGRLVLHEKLSRKQWLAVALAALGVAWMTLRLGALPWIALTLAASFSTYGYLRKTASLGALEGLALETTLLAPAAVVGLGWALWQGQSAMPHLGVTGQMLLVGVGPLTAVPLLLFAAGARRIPMAVLGMLQYLGPSIQLGLGVWFFDESFEGARLQGFVLIWAACALFSADMLMRQQHAATLARIRRDAARDIVDTTTDRATAPAELDDGSAADAAGPDTSTPPNPTPAAYVAASPR